MPIAPSGMARSAMNRTDALLGFGQAVEFCRTPLRTRRSGHGGGCSLPLRLADRRPGRRKINHDGIWFYAQAFNGPIAFATDFARSRLPASMDEKFRTSLGSEPPLGERWLKTKKSWMPSGDKGCPT